MKTFNILIPSYNASKTIQKLINELFQIKIDPENIIVVNDGSSDSTSIFAKELKVIVEDLKQNQGKGAALKKGFEYFIHNSKADFLLCMDADLQHPVESIPDFIIKDNTITSNGDNFNNANKRIEQYKSQLRLL